MRKRFDPEVSRAAWYRSPHFVHCVALGAALGCGDPTQDAGGASIADHEGVASEGCSEGSCGHLDTECSRGTCNPVIGQCTTEPVAEGEPCAIRGLCGKSRCQFGRCVPLAAPDCPASDDECHIGTCDPYLGCTAVRRRAPGSRCETPMPLGLHDASLSVFANTTCSSASSVLASCGAPAGNAVYFAVDLTEMPRRSEIVLALGASTPIESALFRGACDDPALVACGEAAEWHGDAGGVRIRAVLEPDRYWVAAAAREAAAMGPIQLTVSTEPRLADAAGARCDAALALDPEREVQLHASPVGVPSSGDRVECYVPIIQRFYSLDLSSRKSRTLVRVELEGTRGAAVFRAGDGEGCGELLVCSNEIGAVLEPARYLVGIDPSGGLNPSRDTALLRVTLLDASICGEPHTDCARAQPLPRGSTLHHLKGDLACGSYDRGEGAWAFGLRLFYELDLRDRSSPTALAVRSRDARAEIPSVRLLERLPDGTCGGDIWYLGDRLLAPRRYTLILEGAPAPFDLELGLESHAARGPSDCIPPDVIRCVQASVAGCSDTGLSDPRCVAALEECGLQWAPLAELCAGAPQCCDESSTSDRSVDCDALFREAGARCAPCVQEPCWF